MDKIAIISDIHGNLPAFEAVAEDIRRRGIETVFCLGDLVGKGPCPDLAVDRVKSFCEKIITGNWDHMMTRPDLPANMRWHQDRLGRDRIRYLRGLPFSVHFWMSGKKIRLVHASPQSVYTRVQPWDSMEKRLAMFDPLPQDGESEESRITPDVTGYGDIHNAYVQHIEGKTLFNVGSVGNPLDLAQSSYAILEGTRGSKEAGAFSIQIVRVPYDIEEAVRQAQEAGMPELEEYVRELRTARYRGLPQ